MVLAIIVHTTSNEGLPTLRYWKAYAPLTTSEQNQQTEKQRAAERQNLKVIANRVVSEFTFKKDVQEESLEPDDSVRGFETGIFRMKDSDIPNCHSVMWKSSESCAFTLIMLEGENVTSATHILGLITKYAVKLFDLNEGPQKQEQLSEYPEKLSALFEVFLPVGQLLLMNHKLFKHMDKEMNTILAGKK